MIARVLHVATPVLPPLAAQQGIQGTVQVIVSLDVDSHVVGARVQNSPSALLNQAAIVAARETTFRTGVRDCRPVAADYLYSVDFIDKVTLSITSSGERVVSVVGEGTVTRTAGVGYVIATIATHDDVAAFDALKAKLGALGIGESKIRRMSSQQVQITVDVVENTGHAAAAVASLPSVDVIGISFAIKDWDSAYREALSIALKDAEQSAREAAKAEHLHLGVLKEVATPPNGGPRPPAAIRPYRLVPIVGGFKEPDIRIPELEVHAVATVTYAIKP